MKIKDYLLKESDMVVGKEVWHPMFGDGKIVNTEDGNTYPIGVKFRYRDDGFTKDFKYVESDITSSLYSCNILEFEVKDDNLPRVVEVRDGIGSIWERAVLYHVDENSEYPYFVYGIDNVSDIEKGKMDTLFYRFMREIEQPKDNTLEKINSLQCELNRIQNEIDQLKSVSNA